VKSSAFKKYVIKKVVVTLKTMMDYKHVNLELDNKEFFLYLMVVTGENDSLAPTQ
jgi:hypothetical protein